MLSSVDLPQPLGPDDADELARRDLDVHVFEDMDRLPPCLPGKLIQSCG